MSSLALELYEADLEAAERTALARDAKGNAIARRACRSDLDYCDCNRDLGWEAKHR